MWLKLTGAGSGKQCPFNSDNIVTYEESVYGSILICSNGKDFAVTETPAEIELMLMGSKPSVPDPRERNVIGRYIPDDRAEAYLKYGLREEDI